MGFYFANAVLAVMYCGLCVAYMKAPPPKTTTRLDWVMLIGILFTSVLIISCESYLFFLTDSNEIFGIGWGNINLGLVALHSVLMGYTVHRSEQPQ